MAAAEPVTGRLIIGTRRYSSWSLRGWLAVHLAGLDVAEHVVPLAGGRTPQIAALTGGATVPYLEHDGAIMWETLAICEYCAEQRPALWPLEREARAYARAIAAEMHAGFAALRRELPMSLFRVVPAGGIQISEAARADIARIAHLWRGARARWGGDGPYLFGATFGLADAMYAPVVTRFLTYRPALESDTWEYVASVRAHPLMHRWYDAAAAEPEAWFLPEMEKPAS